MAKKKMGRLEVITGCMFSGKTEELIRRLERVRISRGNLLLFKPSIDNRYSTDVVVSHYGRKFEAHLLEPFEENLTKLISLAGKKALDNASVIAFDEGNLFSPKLTNLCNMLVKRGKRVIVAGLDLTFAGKPFKPMPSLMAFANPLDKLTAVCVKCGGVATRTQRLEDGMPAGISSPRILVGGIGVYEARCTRCYEKPQ